MCGSLRIKKFGRTKSETQRFRCLACGKTFTWKEPHVKRYKERRWFELWVREAYSIRQLSDLSGHSEAKLKRIRRYWLSQEPPEKITDLSQHKCLVYDGTYFHKDGCLICLMDAATQKIIASTYADREGFKATHPWFSQLKQRGLYPDAVAMDGEISVLRAIRTVWPKAKIQRCLFHIQREGMRWLRTNPKTEAGQRLRELLSTLCYVKDFKEQKAFIHAFRQWLKRYSDFVQSLPKTEVAFKDLQRTIVLIKNALPDMFCYFGHSLPATTNVLESYYSRLKADYRRHRGLSQRHKIGYLKWYCYYKNSNTS